MAILLSSEYTQAVRERLDALRERTQDVPEGALVDDGGTEGYTIEEFRRALETVGGLVGVYESGKARGFTTEEGQKQNLETALGSLEDRVIQFEALER